MDLTTLYKVKSHQITKFGQRSWRIANREVEAFVSETGGHIGPITFRIGGKKIQPLSVVPWAEEKTEKSLPPIVKVARGDFFCLPFGGNSTPFKGERHPLHGETANNRWHLESVSSGDLHLSMKTKVRAGRVDKYISLRPGETAVYQRHVISGMGGAMSVGHHAMLKFPDKPGSGRISTSQFVHGEVSPSLLENPALGGYSSLQIGGKFRSLTKVPLANGGWTNLRIYPARRGFEDLVLLVNDNRLPLAWTAVTFLAEGYLWFALKNPHTLGQTIFWLSNGGRHYSPWNGRHINVLGLEEVTAYFHYGLAESAKKNSLSRKGHPTCHFLTPKNPLTINYIMAVSAIPKGFNYVSKIIPASDGHSVRLISGSGKQVHVLLNLDFLETKNLSCEL